MAKAVKEAKIAALPPVEEAPKKKRASGKRKPKPKTEEVPKEEVSLNPQQQAENEYAEDAAKKIAEHIDKQIIDDLVVMGQYGIDAESTLANILTDEINKAKQAMPEVMQIERKLSRHAEGWQKWLKAQNMTTEDFIKRYPTHKMRHFIDEIIEFEAQK